DFGDNLIEGRVRCERVADQRHIDAVRQGPFGKLREHFLRPMLPIAAVNEQKGWPIVARLEKVDPVALAPAVSQIEMLGISLAYLGRAPRPIGDDLSAAGHGLAVIETAIAILLAHAAPVQRVE